MREAIQSAKRDACSQFSPNPPTYQRDKNLSLSQPPTNRREQSSSLRQFAFECDSERPATLCGSFDEGPQVLARLIEVVHVKSELTQHELAVPSTTRNLD